MKYDCTKMLGFNFVKTLILSCIIFKDTTVNFYLASIVDLVHEIVLGRGDSFEAIDSLHMLTVINLF